MKRILSVCFFALATLAVLALVSGCPAQLAPSGHSASLSWTAPLANANWPGCSTAQPCSYALGRAEQLTGGSCPSTTSTTNYTVINKNADGTYPTATSYVDPTAGAWCYEAQTVQGSAVSAASNTATAVIPGSPTPPPLNGPTVSESIPEPSPLPQVNGSTIEAALMTAPILTVKITR